MNDQMIHDRIYNILSQKAAMGYGEYDHMDNGDDIYGEGGPPLTYDRYRNYYIRHFGTASAAKIKKAYDERMKGSWLPQTRGASRTNSHVVPRKRKPRKNVAVKRKVTKRKVVKRTVTKKKANNRAPKDQKYASLTVRHLKDLLRDNGYKNYSHLLRSELLARVKRLKLNPKR